MEDLVIIGSIININNIINDSNNNTNNVINSNKEIHINMQHIQIIQIQIQIT